MCFLRRRRTEVRKVYAAYRAASSGTFSLLEDIQEMSTTYSAKSLICELVCPWPFVGLGMLSLL